MLIKRKCRDYMLLPSMQKIDFTIKSRLNISRKYFIHDVFILCNLFPDVWLNFTAKTRVLFGQTKCIWYFNNKIKSYQILNFVLLPSNCWKAFKIIFFKGILFPKFKLYFKCSRFCSHSCLNTNIFCKNLWIRKTLALFTLCCNTAVDRH